MSNPKPQPEQADPTAPADVYHQKFTVPFEYPVHFTRDVFGADNPLFASVLDRLAEHRRHRAAVYVDSAVAAAHPGLIARINEYFHARPEQLELAGPIQTVPGGPQAKRGYDQVRDVMWTIGNLHLDRQSFVVAVGGASVLDMLGFATSIVHRGLRLVRVPTTTLAQNDAGVGVKNGMDEHGAKNFVGTFAPPFAVIDDFSFLSTLSQEHWIGGAAEAFKVAIIKDEQFFDFLCERAADLRRRDDAALEQTIRRCAAIHLDHIRTSGDPFELGSARPLDFGHWAAHKLELMSHFQIGHGQAVAVGIAIDSFYAMRKGLISPEQLERIVAALARCGLPIYLDLLHTRNVAGNLEVLGGLEDFREHLGGALTVTLPDGIGRERQVHQVGADLVAEAVDWLKQRAARG